jgi:hypothetical protein
LVLRDGLSPSIMCGIEHGCRSLRIKYVLLLIKSE